MPDYPSISFSTKTRLPIPVGLPWRDTIGVVGEFSQGPTAATFVDPREFERLYGLDSSSGSVAVQQALSMGAARFVISRAIPSDTQAETTIQFASGNPLNVPPVVGSELINPTDLNPIIDSDNYTTGLTLGVNYVGTPLSARTFYETVEAKVAQINHPNFTQDQGLLNIHIVNFKQGGTTVRQANPLSVLTVGVVTASIGDHQIVRIAKANSVGVNDIDDEAANLQPGYRLSDGVSEVLILAAPYSISSTHWGVLVENLTATTDGDLVGVQIMDPPNDRYIMGYNLRLTSGRSLAPINPLAYYFVKPDEFYNDGYNNNPIQSYFSVPAANGGQYIEFMYDTAPTSAINDKTLLVRESFGTNSDEGIYLVFGQEGVTSPIRAALKGHIVVPFAAASVTVGSDTSGSTLAYTPGVPFSRVVKDLEAAIYSDLVMNSLINEVIPSTFRFPYSLTLQTSIAGRDANRIFYKLTRHVEGTPSLAGDLQIKILENDFGTTEFDEYFLFTNAFTGPKGSFRDFYAIDGTPLVRINAVSPGVSDIRVSLVPDELSSADAPSVVVTVSSFANGISKTEVGQLRMDSIDQVTGEFQNTGLESVSALFLPLVEPAAGTIDPSLYTFLPLRIAPPLGLLSSVYNVGPTAVSNMGAQAVTNVQLVGGSNFSGGGEYSLVEAKVQAYRAAVRRLASADVAFLVIAGLPYGNSAYAEVFNEAFAQARNASAESGLRQVFVETPFNMSPRQSAILSGNIRSEYVTLVNGNVTMALNDGTFATRVGVTGYYAGLLSQRPPHIAPHANYGGQFVQGVLNSTSQSDPDSKNAYSRGRVDSLHFDRGMGRWKFLNGLTTSNDPTKKYVSVVRIRLQFMSDLQRNLQWVLSEPNTRALQRKVETAVEAYMDTALQRGWLLRLGPVVCNETNNTETDMAAGKLYVAISYVPVVPADFGFVNITEDYTLLDTVELVTQPATGINL